MDEEKRAAEERMNAAVGRWLVRKGHVMPDDVVTDIDVDVVSESGCETCGDSLSVDIDYLVNGRRALGIAIAPYDLGAWIGELL